MRRLATAVLALGLLAAVPAVFAQEEHKKEAAEEGGNLAIWKWANFVILAGAVGYLIGKNAGPFFDGRSRQIRKEIIEADEARQAAETRVAEVERRLANLEGEIASLREEAAKEAEAETHRLAQHSANEIAKVQAHSEQEIASAAKAARMELKRYASELAIGLAERKLRDRITPETQEALVQGFVHDLK